VSEYLCLADIHATKRPPSSCTETYWDDLKDLLMQTVQVARERKVTAVIWAGDVFHHKAPSRTSHELVQDLKRIIEAYPCPVWVTAGNHDMQNDRQESVGTTQPLGVLEGPAAALEGWSPDGVVYGVPWLQGYGNHGDGTCGEVDYRVGAALGGYREMVQEMPHLVVAHAPLYPPGKELTYEYFPAGRWAEAMGGQGSVFYGHVHEPHGVWTAGGVTFCNNGALSRGSLHEYNLERQVGCTIWSSDTGEFEFVPLDARPASEVFRLAEADLAKTSTAALDSFLEDVGQTRLEVLSVESVLRHIRELDVGKDVEDLAEELLAEAAQGGKK
jgi:DNA repair exonuclease SbcCD nuclease subunit